MMSVIWVSALILSGIYVLAIRKTPLRELASYIRSALFKPKSSQSWGLLAFFLIAVFSPLVIGLDFFLKTDANVLVVIFFLFWLYQWIKIVWNSEEKFQ